MLVIVSGRSGSGKSFALRALEDMGFYCVDNIPITLLPDLINTLKGSKESVAISLDIRNLPDTPQRLTDIFSNLSKEINPVFIFLDTDREILIRRYNDTRRLHPLANKKLSLEEAIDVEYGYLQPLIAISDIIINTSHLSVHELAELLREKLAGKKEKELTITIKSFGFKYGLPSDANYVFDVRFLPNPHWITELKPLTGHDQPVIDYLFGHQIVANFIYQTCHYLDQWLPSLERNNRSYLTIAIGCTGGQHRSVYIAEQMGNYFLSQGKIVIIKHREQGKK